MFTTRNAIAVLGLILLPAAIVSAEVQVADVFGPNMVLQRDMPAPVWGAAEPGEKITVRFAGQTKTAAADKNGRWLVTLGPMKAATEPQTLTTQGDEQPVSFEGILVGEVWLVLTNRYVRMYQTAGPPPYPVNRIRSFWQGRGRSAQFSNAPQASFGKNPPWGPNRGSNWGVLTCHLSNRLHERLSVPVGIVQVRVDNLDSATPHQGFAAVKELADVSERVETWFPSTARGAAAHAQWLRETRQWAAHLRRDLDSGAKVTPSQPPLAPGPVPEDPTEPTVIFNGMIHPLVPLAVRGAVHARGDASAGDVRYTAKMHALIRGLRTVFRQPDMPVCMLQQPNPGAYYLNALATELDVHAWAAQRDRQRRVLTEKNTGLVVTADIDGHPIDAGERIAAWMLRDVYKTVKDRPAMGPIYRGHRIDGDRVVIEFDHVGRGLMAAEKLVGKGPAETKDRGLKFFAVAGADRVWHRAEAKIEGKNVVVASDKVSKPLAVRYAFQIAPRGMSLYNRDGLPASPFRTDDWPLEDLPALEEQHAGKTVPQLVSLLGYPADLSSHAAARALAAHGEEKVLPILHKLLADADPDLRCGALRTMGYLYWLGPVDTRGGRYRRIGPQTMTPAIEDAVKRICASAGDKDVYVRYAVAEGLGLIGSENEQIAKTLQTLAADREPLVRCAALKVTKFRLKQGAHFVAAANAALSCPHANDHESATLATLLLSSACRAPELDVSVVTGFMLRQDLGTCGPAPSNIGVMVFRGRVIDKGEHLFVPAALHLYGLGCRDWGLHGMEKRILAKPEYRGAVQKKIGQLKTEIGRLTRDKPPQWLDRKRCYEDAVAGLEELIGKNDGR